MTAKIKLNAASGGGSVSLKAPSSTTSNAAIELQLPVADGSADEVLKTDGSGNLSFTAAGGITVAQQFRLAADQAGSGSAGTVLTNWEESDTDYQRVGSSAWSQSSGIFSCSATGIYLCQWTLVVNNTSVGDGYDPNIQISTDSGSNYNTRSRSWAHIAASTTARDSPQNQFIFDVANTSTFRLRYRESQSNDMATGTTIAGSSSENLTNILFIRLGDT